MRWMILRMIATGSLSAFSGLALPGPAALPQGPEPLRTAKAAPAAASAPRLPTPTGSAPTPTRALPRGSLLDLSV